jgi:hypothetical protein
VRISPRGSGSEGQPKSKFTHSAIVKLAGGEQQAVPDLALDAFQKSLPSGTRFCSEDDEIIGGETSLEEYFDLSPAAQTAFLPSTKRLNVNDSPILDLYYTFITGLDNDKKVERPPPKVQNSTANDRSEEVSKKPETKEPASPQDKKSQQKDDPKGTEPKKKNPLEEGLKKPESKEKEPIKEDSKVKKEKEPVKYSKGTVDAKELKDQVKIDRTKREFTHLSTSESYGKLKGQTSEDVLSALGDSTKSVKAKTTDPADFGSKNWRKMLSGLGLLNGYLPVTSAGETPSKAPLQAFEISYVRKIIDRPDVDLETGDKNSGHLNNDPKMDGTIVQDDEYIENSIPKWESCTSVKVKAEFASTEVEFKELTEGFSATTMYLAMSGSMDGVEAGAGAAGSIQSADNHKTTKTEFKSQLVGYSEMPYVKLSLTQHDMKLTQSCVNALERIRQNPTVDSVIKFRKDFGTFFTTTATLGGRLYSTQTKVVTDKAALDDVESKIKGAFEASVSVPDAFGASAGAIHEEESASSSTQAKTTSSFGLSWLAVGGSRLKAQSPPEWRASTAEPANWAIIHVDDAFELPALISQFPGFEDIPSLFRKLLYAGKSYVGITVPWSSNFTLSEDAQIDLLGCGVQSSTGKIMKKAASYLLEDVTEQIRSEEKIKIDITKPMQDLTKDTILRKWKIIQEASDFDSELSHINLPDSDKRQIFGSSFIPSYLESLRMNDHTFCIMLTQENVIKEHTVNPYAMTVIDDVRVCAANDDGQDFYNTYGDHYIFSYATQRKVVVVWKLEVKYGGLLKHVVKQIEDALKANAETDLRDICTNINEMCQSNLVKGTVRVFKTSKDTGGFVEDRSSYSVSEIYNIIKSISGADVIPVDFVVGKLASVIPQLLKPLDALDQELIKSRNTLLRDIAFLHSRAWSLPLVENSTAKTELIKSVETLTKTFNDEQSNLARKGTRTAARGKIVDMIGTVGTAIDLPYAINEWVRHAYLSELDLQLGVRTMQEAWKLDAPPEWFQNKWNQSVWNEVWSNQWLTYRPCHSSDAKTTGIAGLASRKFAVEGPPGYRLASWEFLGNHIDGNCIKSGRSSREVWTWAKQRIDFIIFPADYNDNSKLLKSWWVSEEKFPLIESHITEMKVTDELLALVENALRLSS